MDKTILIAGCDGRVGRRTAELFSQRGWKVAGIDIKGSTDAKVDKFLSVDVRDVDALNKAIDEIDSQMPITTLFNTAGYSLDKDFEETDAAEWADLLDTILGGSSNLCKAVGPKMVERGDGRIILLSCDYSRQPGDCVNDAVAAGSLHGFAKSFGVEVAENNVLVNVLFANTPLDLDKVAETVYWLGAIDTYTSAQVVSVTGSEE